MPGSPDAPSTVRQRSNGATRDLDAARQAYSSGNVELSRLAHSVSRASSEASDGSSPMPKCEPGHDVTDSDESLCAVFGAYEGVVVATALIATCHVAGLDPTKIIPLAFVVILAIAFALFGRDYIRFRAYKEHYDHERAREQWELKHFREGEVREMVELYEAEGFSHEDATTVIETMAKHNRFFVDLMMSQELHLPPPTQSCVRNALATATSFLVFGVSSLATYAGVCASFRIPALSSFVLPYAPAGASASLFAVALTVVWTSIFWGIAKFNALRQHRQLGASMHLLTLASGLTVAFIAAMALPLVQGPLSTLLTDLFAKAEAM